MARTRRSNIPSSIPVESSWRMVDGENDSFDTTLIQDPLDEDLIFNSQQSQVTSSSQAQPFSQDSIRDFADNADEDNAILLAPFRPSLASTRHASLDKDLTPVPEFHMPTVGTAVPRRASAQLAQSVRSVANSPAPQDSPRTRRAFARAGSTEESFHRRTSPKTKALQRKAITRELELAQEEEYERAQEEEYERECERERKPHSSSTRRAEQQQTLGGRFTNSVPEFLFNCSAWVLSVAGMTLSLAKWPVAVFFAVYLAFSVAMVGKEIVTQSATASFQPICRIPGVSLLNLGVCPTVPTIDSKAESPILEFDELMNAQANFEKVLEDSAMAVSLPLEMKRTEASVRDLRTVIKYSDLPGREELVYEFDGYIDSVRLIINDLQSFNTHVGGAVDSVIGVNRWTSRFIDSVAVNREAHNGFLSWIMSPFQPAVFDERYVIEKYIEHTSFVSNKIEGLILEAQAILRLLSQADDHLQRIQEYVVRNDNSVKEKRSEVLWNIWTIIGANNGQLKNLSAKLALLRQVDSQRTTAVSQLLSLVYDLGDIQTKLSDLRDRVAAPGLLADTTSIPLSVHIETINAGVERLEAARTRIRAQENERLKEVLSRGKDEIPLIEG